MSVVINTIGGGGGSSGSGWELLWENQHPDTSFSGQEVQIDLSNYQEVFLVYHNASVSSFYPCSYCLIGYTMIQWTMIGGKLTTRNASPTSTGVTFGNGEYYNSYGSGTTTDNGRLIPYRIFAR